jgi:hypothetical protein
MGYQHIGYVSILFNQSVADCNDNALPDECDLECGPAGRPCDVAGCGQSLDCNANAVPDECDPDADGDGLPDDCDAVPDSDMSPTLVIGGDDTGVPNRMPSGDGATMADHIAALAADAANHGAFAAGVAHLANAWRRSGWITHPEKAALQRAAAKAEVP